MLMFEITGILFMVLLQLKNFKLNVVGEK